MLIVDAHCHAGTGDGFTGPWDTDAPLGAYTARARAAGVTHTVLFSAFHSDYAVGNRNVAAIVASDPRRLFGFAFVHAVRDAGRVHTMLHTAVTRYHFCGVKVHRHDARLTREVCEAARAHSLPLLYDPAGEISTVDLAASAYPDVTFIIPHLGSFADDWSAQRALIDVLERRSNVYADTSGVRRFDILEEAVARAGPHKLIFGTDGPWLHPAVELEKVRQLRLPRESEALILGGNWLRLTARARRRASPASSAAPLGPSELKRTVCYAKTFCGSL